jgi:hypothetical protein
MFGMAEWEDETRQNETRQSSTVEAADLEDYFFLSMAGRDARHEGRSQFLVTP